jgi:hypothetical protein
MTWNGITSLAQSTRIIKFVMARVAEDSGTAVMLLKKWRKIMAGPGTSFGKRVRTDALSSPLPVIPSEVRISDEARHHKRSAPDDKKTNWTVLRKICGVFYILAVTVIGVSLFERADKTPGQLVEAARSNATATRAAEARKVACAKDYSALAFVMAQSEGTKRLASPSSASYPILESKTQLLGDCLYRIKAVVDSQNGFGAMIRTPWSGTVEYHPVDGTWQVKSLSIGG